MPDNKNKKQEVTDKALLDQLNAEDNTQGATTPKREEVADPALLAQLNSGETTQKKSPSVSANGSAPSSSDGENISSQNNLWQTNKPGYVDSVLDANKNLDWVQRLHDKNPETIQVKGEEFPSTHLMSDNGEGYVFPRIQKINGKLTDLGDKAEDYARETNTGIQLPKEKGTWFANNGYKTGSNVLSGSLSPEERNKILGIQDPQEVVNSIFGKDISGNPIISTNLHKPPPVVDSKEETNQAVNTLANHVMQNALSHYGDNLNNTQFTEPGNVIHDITNPHGDAQMTSSYAKYGIDQLKLQRQHELTQLAQSGGPTDPNYQQQEDAINSKYNEQIGALQSAAMHLTSLQLANREYAAKKYTQAESEEQLADLNKEYKKELSTATGGGDVNVAKTAYEKAKADIKRNTKYDAVQLGIEQQKMFGNKTAEEDLVKYNNGIPIPDDRKVAYQLNGLNIVRTGAKNASADGNPLAWAEMDANSDNIQERLEKDNPKYFQKQYAQQIGSYLYKNEHNPLFGTLFARGVPEKEEIKTAGKAIGLTPDQIRQVKPEDVPTTSSMLGQAAQGAFNAFLFQDDKDPYGELFTGKMPREQHTFNNWRGVTGEIASGAGTIAGFLAQGGIVGEGLKSGELLGNVATKAKSYETASNLIPLALSNYNNAYEQSKEVIGDKPKDELKRHAYAVLNATLSTAIMSIDPATALGKEALGATKEGKDIIGMLKKDGLSDISRNDFKDKIQTVIAHAATTGEETAKHIGSQALIMASNKAAENVTDMLFDPEHRHGIMDNVGQSAIQGGISMLLPSLFAGINASKMQNPSTKELLWDVGNNSKDYRNQVTDLYKQGKMSQDDFFTAINGINKAAGIIKSEVPAANVINGKALTPAQQKDYAWNLLQTNEVTDNLEKLNGPENSDKSQVKLVNDRLNELAAERSKILDKAGEMTPVEKPVLKITTEPTGQQENISTKTPDKSKEELSLESQSNTSSEKSTENERTNEAIGHENEESTIIRSAEDSEANPEVRQAEGVGQRNGEEVTEAPGETHNKEGGAEMQPPISVSGRERRKKKPTPIYEDTSIPIVEEPNLQTQDLGTAKGQPEADTKDQVKEATIKHPDQPADVLISDNPQGESFNESKDRYKKAVDAVTKDAPDNTVVVTHSWGLKLLDAVEKTGWDHPDLAAEHQKGTTEPGDLIPYKMEDGRTIWFARHGETKDNLNDLQRTNDTPLTDKGREQASEIADKLKEKGITPSQIITSDLPRAKETSDIISKEFSSIKPDETANPFKANWNYEGEGDALSGKSGDKAYVQRMLPEWNRANQRGEINPDSKVSYVSSDSKNSPYVLAKDENGVIIASIKASTKNGKDFGKAFNIEHIVVAPEFRRRGIATELYKKIKEINPNVDLSHTDLRSKDFEKFATEISSPPKVIPPKSNKKIGDAFRSVVKEVGESRLAGILMNWNESRLSDDGERIISPIGRDANYSKGKEGGQVRIGKKEFIEWVLSNAPFDEKIYGKGIKENEEWVNDINDARKAIEPHTEIPEPQKPTENASTQSEEQQQESAQQSGEPEHARTEQAGSEKQTTKSENSDSAERSERGQEEEIKTEDKPVETIQSNGANATVETEQQLAQPQKETSPEERLKEIDLDLQKQHASQKIEQEKGKAATKAGDIESINKHKDNYYKKQDRIDKLEAEKEDITNKLEKESRQSEIKQSYTDSANRIREFGKKITANSEGMAGAFPGISPKLVGKFIDHVADIVEHIGNLHVAIDAAIHWYKEQFPEEKVPTPEEFAQIKQELHWLRPEVHTEPVIGIDNEEYAKDLLADVNDGKLTYDEVVQEVMDEELLSRDGKPVSDAISRKTKAKIINYLDWHDKDRAIHNASLAEPGEKNNVLKDYVLTNGDVMTKFLSGETIEKRTGDTPLNPQQVIKYNLELAATDAQSMVSKIKHHFGADILDWAPAMIKQIDKLPGGDTVKRVTALLGLMDELRKDQGIYEYERTQLTIEKNPDRVKEVNRYLSEIPKILKSAEKTYQTTQREASKTLNAGRIIAKLFTGKFAHELHADEAVLAPKQQKEKSELEDKEADTKIPDKVAEEGVVRDEKTADKEVEEAQENITSKPLTKGKGKSTVERMKESGAKRDKKEKAATEQLKKEAMENLAKKGMTPENMFDKIKDLIKKNPC